MQLDGVDHRYIISVRLNLKYRRFATSSCKDLGIRNFELVAKTHVLCFSFWFHPANVRQKEKEHLMDSSCGFDFSHDIEEKLNYPVRY